MFVLLLAFGALLSIIGAAFVTDPVGRAVLAAGVLMILAGIDLAPGPE